MNYKLFLVSCVLFHWYPSVGSKFLNPLPPQLHQIYSVGLLGLFRKFVKINPKLKKGSLIQNGNDCDSYIRKKKWSRFVNPKMKNSGLAYFWHHLDCYFRIINEPMFNFRIIETSG